MEIRNLLVPALPTCINVWNTLAICEPILKNIDWTREVMFPHIGAWIHHTQPLILSHAAVALMTLWYAF
jgi:hypothetical protein